ncbi:MAG: hypothetical protein RL258_616, partial [Pseudomonadota bacterium]
RRIGLNNDRLAPGLPIDFDVTASVARKSEGSEKWVGL